jgi:hypothetical protein
MAKKRSEDITVKEHATIIQKRCAITVATKGVEDPEDALTTRGIIRVGPVKRLGNDGDYAFEISEQDQFEFRGRQRREVIWICMVYVTPEHEVRVYQERGGYDPVPDGVLDCVTTPISRTESLELRR